ncbi:MAG: bacillithiol system redox-active protein YtxJ [Flavobacteriales bacterium]|nr:bacillithiol system redox-active protein YtxJ [Flavobacteriales bacterium]
MPLASSADLDLCFQNEAPDSLVLKHSTRCALSSMAKSRLEKKKDDRLTYFIVDVIKNRDISDLLASRSGVRHESPQAFLIHGGKVIEVKSHLAINAAEFSKSVDSLSQTQN